MHIELQTIVGSLFHGDAQPFHMQINEIKIERGREKAKAQSRRRKQARKQTARDKKRERENGATRSQCSQSNRQFYRNKHKIYVSVKRLILV